MRSNCAVSTYFEALFPRSVKKVTIMLELPELEALIAKRDAVANKLGMYGHKMYAMEGMTIFGPWQHKEKSRVYSVTG